MNFFGIIIFLCIIQGILFAGHYFLFLSYRFFFGLEGRIFLIFWTLLSLWFIFASLLGNLTYNQVLSWFYTGATVWLGSLLWQVIAALLAWGVWFAFHPNKQVVFGLFLVAAIGMTVYGIIHATNTQIVRYSVPIANLPQSWVDKKAVLVSDVHCGQIRGPGFAQKVANIITEQKPDVVLVAGDFFDGPPTDYQACAEPFGKIPSTYGTYFVEGNHEEFRNAPYSEALRKAGVIVLDNRFEDIEGLRLIGIDYRTSTRKDLSAILQSMKSAIPTILFMHSPAEYKTAEETDIDLYVAGHSHKGQMWPGPLITKAIYKGFDYGLNYSDKTAVVTTSGVGTWGPPLRIGTNSEIVTITFTPRSQ